MKLFDAIIAKYPELLNSNVFVENEIQLQDDSYGLGAYIVKWDYSQPIPDGLKLGK